LIRTLALSSLASLRMSIGAEPVPPWLNALLSDSDVKRRLRKSGVKGGVKVYIRKDCSAQKETSQTGTCMSRALPPAITSRFGRLILETNYS
jgi:hypothetical protein